MVNIGARSTYTNVPAVHDSVFVNNVDQDLVAHINTIPGSVSFFFAVFVIFFMCLVFKRFLLLADSYNGMAFLSVAVAVQPKDDVVKFWQSVVGPKYDIVVSSSTVEKLFCVVSCY